MIGMLKIGAYYFKSGEHKKGRYNPNADYGVLSGANRSPAPQPRFNQKGSSDAQRPKILMSDMLPSPGGMRFYFRKRRKSGAPTHDGNDTAPHRSRVGRNGRSKIKEDPGGQFLKAAKVPNGSG